MSFYDGLAFFILLSLGCIPAIILGMKEKRIGNYTILFSIGIIFIIYRETPLELFYLLLYLFLEWHLIALYQYSLRRFGRNKEIFHHAVFFALLPLVMAKLSGFIGIIGFHFWEYRILRSRFCRLSLRAMTG